jgi:hypothetical protein
LSRISDYPAFVNVDQIIQGNAFDENVSSHLQALPEQILSSVHVSDNLLTVGIDRRTSSDVASVRSPDDLDQPPSMPSPSSAPSQSSIPSASDSSATATTHIALEGVLLQAERENSRAQTDQSGAATTLSALVDAIRPPQQQLDSGIDPIPVTRSNHAINEFTCNDQLLLGGFPYLFLLGRKIPTTGPLPSSFQDMLLRQYDNRFAQCHPLLLLLFNQLQRSTNIRHVSARAKANHSSIQHLQALLNSAETVDRLQAAVDNPDSLEAQMLLREILPSIRVTGAKTPFSPAQRAQGITNLTAMV